MKIVFRADASIQIGSGHVMRCLTLADALRERGTDVRFICRDLPGHLGGVLADKGYPVHWLPAPGDDGTAIPAHTAHSAWLGVPWAVDADQTREQLAGLPEIEWLIVDHYALDRAWESGMRPLVKRIMVIDDLADRPHDCDLLLDQNLYGGMEQRYAGLVPADCRPLLGPRYALLRPEFREARQTLRQRDGVVRRILVFFGGADPSNETAKALRAIQRLERPDIAVDVVVGSTNPHRAEIEALCAELPNASFHCQVANMAELMARADLAISASGLTSYELAYMGVPSLLLPLNPIQAPFAARLAACGVAVSTGFVKEFPFTAFIEILQKLLISDTHRLSLINAGKALFDGNGVWRVADLLIML